MDYQKQDVVKFKKTDSVAVRYEILEDDIKINSGIYMGRTVKELWDMGKVERDWVIKKIWNTGDKDAQRVIREFFV